jgi:hypothetical protein
MKAAHGNSFMPVGRAKVRSFCRGSEVDDGLHGADHAEIRNSVTGPDDAAGLVEWFDASMP